MSSPTGPKMPFECWSKLDLTQCLIWDKLSPSAKSTILGMYSLPAPSPAPPQHINLHEISAYD
jgi:hypothetical protein